MKIWTNTKTLDGFINEFEITENKADADIALIGSKPIILDEFPKLKGIFRAGIGRDNVPIEEAVEKGVRVKFPAQKTIDKIYEETANFTCYLVLRMMYSAVGTLDPWIKYNRTILNDRTLLVIGTGNIGKRVFNKMKTLMTVKTFDILSNSEDELRYFIAGADCITIHIPKQSKNINFIDAEKLSWMKDGAVIVNTSRGALVSEDALYHELKAKRLKAAFDVFWEEPYYGKLKEFYPEYFFMSPHIASTSNAFLEGSAIDFRNLIKEIEND